MEARKLSSGEVKIAKLDDALFPSVLPKDRVPPSYPKNRVRGMDPVTERLSASHSTHINKRLLGSAPSPGIGH